MAAEEMTSMRADDLLRTPRDQRDISKSEIMTEWSDWLYGTHGGGLPTAVLDKLYGKAWQDGHSSGLYEVESYFIELVDLAIEIIEAAR